MIRSQLAAARSTPIRATRTRAMRSRQLAELAGDRVTVDPRPAPPGKPTVSAGRYHQSGCRKEDLLHRLAVFDLDGTLVASTRVDAECYLEAVRRELGFELDSDWAGYRHCTDSGILREGVGRHYGRAPLDDEVARVRACFFGLLEDRLRDNRTLCQPMPGASALLAKLAEEGWHACVATGGWSTSARLKLRAASLPPDLPLFSSDLTESREEIVRVAIAATAQRCGIRAYDRVVALGDGVWDVRAARQLGLAFLGVGRGERARRLEREGAAAVVGDFADTSAVMTTLGSVGPPA